MSSATIEREQLAEHLGRILVNPALPEDRHSEIKTWTEGDPPLLFRVKPESLSKLIASLMRTELWALGDIKIQPSTENAAARDYESPGVIPDADQTPDFDDEFLDQAHARPVDENTTACDTDPFPSIPGRLKSMKRWLLHRSKVPYYIDGTKRTGELDEPADVSRLATYAEAITSLKTRDGFGLGFAIVGGDGIIALDADKVLGNEKEADALALLGNTYIEKSPSGNGLHAFYFGKLKLARKKAEPFECYTEKRFFTMTGNIIGRSATDVSDASQEDIERIAAVFGIADAECAVTQTTVDRLDSVLSAQQIMDARAVSGQLKMLGKHEDEDIWHRYALAVCRYGEDGLSLLDDFSKGAKNYKGRADCKRKIDEKLRAIAGGNTKAIAGAGIGKLFNLGEEHGFPNPATGRKSLSASEDFAPTKTKLSGGVSALFSEITLTSKDTDDMLNAEFWIPNLIVKGHIISYPARSGGGKTTIFIHHCEALCAAGAEVYYINVDSPPDKLKQQQIHAEQHGYKVICPDAKAEKSIDDAIKALKALAGCDEDLSNIVLIFDTLKKFIGMLNKDTATAFYKLLRKIAAQGATICLLSHTNKYLGPDGKPIYEGTGDHRTDIDDMIYLDSYEDEETGIITVTTRPDKERAVWAPRSYQIHRRDNMRVDELTEVIPVLNEDEALVLKVLERELGDTYMNKTDVLKMLLEETPFGRDRLRTALFNLCEGQNSPVVSRKMDGRQGSPRAIYLREFEAKISFEL